MANTYYDSQLTAAEIEAALEAIDGILTPANNGKVLAISNGKFEARSVQWGGGSTLEPLSVTANGDYTPEAGIDGFDEVHVAVPNSYSASDEGKVVNNGSLVAQTARASQITQNGTYDTTLNDEVTVNVSGSVAVIQPLNVTQNGTYNPPSGVDGYAPVVVNVSGGGGSSLLNNITPLHNDMDKGYITNGVFVYAAGTGNLIDVFPVESGKHYICCLGSTVGSRFRVAFFTVDPDTVTSNLNGVSISNTDNPSSYTIAPSAIMFSPSDNGFIAIGKTNSGVYGLKSYVGEFNESVL